MLQFFDHNYYLGTPRSQFEVLMINYRQQVLGGLPWLASGGTDQILRALPSRARTWDLQKISGCRLCVRPRPERAHHCLKCGVCVLRMDSKNGEAPYILQFTFFGKIWHTSGPDCVWLGVSENRRESGRRQEWVFERTKERMSAYIGRFVHRGFRREFNAQTDFLCNYAMDNDAAFTWISEDLMTSSWRTGARIVIYTDGGLRPHQQKAAFSRMMYLIIQNGTWINVAQGIRLHTVTETTTSLELELCGEDWALQITKTMLNIDD